LILLGSALSIGFIHTLIGPDHYLPFIVISRARNWSTSRTMFVTFVCGLGHVLSSIVIGAVGIGFGAAVGNLVAIEKTRGDIASYLLIAFGLAYGIWGLWRGRKGQGHIHLHGGKHLDSSNARSVTFWTLFIVFILGPCEPLIPLLMFPAVSYDCRYKRIGLGQNRADGTLYSRPGRRDNCRLRHGHQAFRDLIS
jgi:sulfite exporter TauE/SafE